MNINTVRRSNMDVDVDGVSFLGPQDCELRKIAPSVPSICGDNSEGVIQPNMEINS